LIFQLESEAPVDLPVFRNRLAAYGYMLMERRLLALNVSAVRLAYDSYQGIIATAFVRQLYTVGCWPNSTMAPTMSVTDVTRAASL
jgi:hypothetical protein